MCGPRRLAWVETFDLGKRFVSLSPARWHSTNTHLSSFGIRDTEPDYFPMQQPLLWISNLNKC